MSLSLNDPSRALSGWHFRPWPWPAGVILVISLWRLGIAAGLPVTQDEAYYFDWARTLQWGYFDHPPAVALLGFGAVLEPGSVLAARAGGWLVATLALLVLWRFLYQCGLRDQGARPGALTLALALTGASLSGFAAGVLTTPDTPLALCWVLALHEGLAALSGRRWRWLTTGVAVGLGLLSKYTMLLIGPVFLLAIVLADPGALRSRWPYLGALVAILVFAPNLVWNAHNDWLSLRFQFGHGFSTETGTLHFAAQALPSPVHSTIASASVQEGAEPMSAVTRVARGLDYALSQLALLGLMGLPLVAALLGWRAGATSHHAMCLGTLSKPARSLLLPAAFFPMLLFAWVATFSEVEANWPAMSLPALAAVLVLWLRPRPPWLLSAAAANLVVLGLYAVHAATGVLPLGDAQGRILRESHGYAEVARLLEPVEGPVLADRYQTAAMLNFYQHRHKVSQWPGLTRDSEYSRGVIATLPSMRALDASGFWLVSSRFTPEEIPGFNLGRMRQYFDCAGKSLHELTAADPGIGCEHPLHFFRLAHYQPASSLRPNGDP